MNCELDCGHGVRTSSGRMGGPRNASCGSAERIWDWEPPRESERVCVVVMDVSEPRRRSLEERLGCEPSELREVDEEDAVEFGCGSP